MLLSPYVAWQDIPEAWEMGFQDPATLVEKSIEVDVDTSTTTSGLIGLLGLGGLSLLAFLLLTAISMRGRDERRPITICVIARRHFWEYNVYGPGGTMKVVYSRRLANNPRMVNHPLMVPYNRPLQFIMESPEGVICRWTVISLGIDFLASPGRRDGGILTIRRQGLYSGIPYSEAAYPGLFDLSYPMPVVIEVVSFSRYYDWFWFYIATI
jgi:heme/copper-type cytochrome/quinol oxidase subunit 2